MRRVLSACAVALCVAGAGLSAQDTTIKSKTKIKADDAKTMTVTGCLTGGPAAYVLSNAGTVGGDHEHGAAVGTAGVVTSYDLTARNGVDLTSHAGQKVQITGVMIEPAKHGDDDAKIEIREKTKVDREDAPDTKGKSTTKLEVPRGPLPKLAVTAVTMVSPSC